MRLKTRSRGCHCPTNSRHCCRTNATCLGWMWTRSTSRVSTQCSGCLFRWSQRTWTASCWAKGAFWSIKASSTSLNSTSMTNQNSTTKSSSKSAATGRVNSTQKNLDSCQWSGCSHSNWLQSLDSLTILIIISIETIWNYQCIMNKGLTCSKTW